MARSSTASAPKPKTIKVESEALSLARAKWESSGLKDEHAKRLRFRPLSAEETESLGKFHAARSLHMPYFGLDGKPTQFFRIRYLEKLPGLAGLAEKPQRYAQPAGTLNEVYLPPLLDQSWADIAKDTSVTIHFTEGELKAACACANGLATLGLGGVDVWRSTKRGIDLLPLLQEIKWENRHVVIIYDSDAATNPNVVRAQRKLARELVSLGALPSIAALPARLDGSKQGLDDFIVAGGDLSKIIREAPAFPEADALWSLNEEVVYVANPGIVIVKDDGRRIDPGSFMAHAFANRHYMETTSNKDGALVMKKKKLAPRWIEWERRHELAGITYAPGKPQIHEDQWNSWPGWGCEPIKGDISPWHWLLDFVFKGHPEYRKWFEQWCAYPIQHPGSKLYTAVVIWGYAHGTGKSFISYALQGIYGKNAITIGNKDLRGGFNAWQANKQFIYGDEIAGGSDVNAKKIDADWLKQVIVQPTAKINEKYMPEIVVPDVSNYIFNSNKQDNCFMEDGDRRYFVHEVLGKPATREFYERVDQWLGLRNGEYHGPGRAHLFHHLLNVDLTGFNPREHAPMTQAKEQLIRGAKSDVGTWAMSLTEDPTRLLMPLGEEAAKNCDLFSTAQLLHCYDPDKHGKVSIVGLGRELSKHGFREVNEGVTVRTNMGIIRLRAVRNVERWINTSPKLLREHYDRFFGAGTTKHT